MILPQGSLEAARRVAETLQAEGFKTAAVREDDKHGWVVVIGGEDKDE
jgi:N-acetylmuramoyl-L-alanine amidase